MKKIKLLTMVAVVISLLTGSIFCYAAVIFKDIKTTNWAHTYVSKLVELGGINGYNDGTFKPSNTITNAEFIKILVGSTVGEQPKSDTHWASGYLDKAVELEILQNNQIAESDYNKPMTRELMATAVAKTTEKVLKEDIACPERSVVAGSIKDYGSIKDSYQGAVVDVYNAGIITGYADGKFKPRDTATRAEASTMIVRMLDKEQRKAYEPTQSVKEVPIGEMIENLDWNNNKDLPSLKTCVVDTDVAKYEMEIFTNPVNGAVGVSARYIYSTTYFIKDKKVVGEHNIMTDIDGYTVFGWAKGDITTVDYIGAYDAYTDILTVIPNPFKQ